MTTLRGRIALLTTAVVAVAFLLTGAVIVSATGRAQSRALEGDLRDRLALLQGAVGRPGPGPAGRPGAASPGEFVQLRRAAERALGPGFFVVVRRDDTVLLTLGDEPASLPPAGGGGRSDQTTTFTDEAGTRYLVRTTAVGPLGVMLTIGADRDLAVGADQRRLRDRFLLVGLIATGLTGLITFAAVGAAARPLRRLRETTARVAETEDLTTRVTVDGAPAEIADVADGLNRMLGRLETSTAAREASLHAARRFAADAGHELRTPLTAMQATLDALERNTAMEPGMRSEAIGEVAEETRRLSALLASLQTLARADAGLPADVGPLDLRDVVDQAVDAARQRHRGTTFVLELDQEPVPVTGSAPWLRSVVDNLLRNAAVHGRAGGTATVSLRRGASSATLRVDDDGPGFPAQQRDRAFERFTRGADAAERPGSGLGLALVAQLIALHGGSVDITDAPTGGARVTVQLPLREGSQ